MQNIDKIKCIKLNTDKNKLDCEDIGNVKKCQVPLSHFEGKQNGYYFIHHLNNDYKYVINFETFGVKVILPENNNDNKDSSGIIKAYFLSQFIWLGLLIL